ncbi:MAG TPA: hypothetical protein VLQ91_11550 [Draconibacterium sp.]|nr:hypothetical protein [Draconibacterium sp.]
MWNQANGDSLFGGMTYMIIGIVLHYIKKAKSKERRLNRNKKV